MVETIKVRYGADIVEQRLKLAGCDCSGGTILVNQLTEIGIDEINAETIKTSGLLQFSISEESAIIKRIKIPTQNNHNGKELAKFEFTSTLIDKKEDLYIEANSVNGGSQYLVYGCHKFLIEKQHRFLADRLLEPSGYKLRMLAMADGYQNYCWREGGELVCLLDITPVSISYCFINNDKPVLVGSITGSADENKSGQIPQSLLNDLKITMQYNIANLFKSGISAPLSLIVVSGSLAGQNVNETVEEKLGIRTISPAFKTALFDSEIVDRAAQFLVCLGLTVDKK